MAEKIELLKLSKKVLNEIAEGKYDIRSNFLSNVDWNDFFKSLKKNGVNVSDLYLVKREHSDWYSELGIKIVEDTTENYSHIIIHKCSSMYKHHPDDCDIIKKDNHIFLLFYWS